MPHISQGSKKIKNLQTLTQLYALKTAITSALESSDESEESSDESEIEGLIYMLIQTKRKRYMNPRTRLAKAPDIFEYFWNLDPLWFKQEFRLLCDTLEELTTKIEHHPIFHNNSNVPQRPVIIQLIITLKRMGTYGNGSSVGMLAQFFRVSEGTIILYSKRVIAAILSLEK